MVPARDNWLFNGQIDTGAVGERRLILGQMVDEGFAQWVSDVVSLGWEDFFKLASSAEYANAVLLLGTPPIENWIPTLSSRGTLTDPDFRVLITSWTDPQGASQRGNVDLTGAVITTGQSSAVLCEATWRTLQAVEELRVEARFVFL